MSQATIQELQLHIQYKKMAGTAAVFVASGEHADRPVERDGLSWSAKELHLYDLKVPKLIRKEPVASILVLEGLEDYDPAQSGDVRHVNSLQADMLYVPDIKGWVEIDRCIEHIEH